MDVSQTVWPLKDSTLMDYILHILDSIPEGVAVINRDSVVTYANPAYTRILGIPTSKILGKRLSDIEPEASAMEVFKTGESIRAKYEFVRTLGKHILLDCNGIYIDGEIVGVVSVFRDISDIISLHDQLQYYRNCALNLEKKYERADLPLPFKSLIGDDQSFVKVLQLAARVAPTNAAILIEGESGVGKEIVAKSIHAASSRSAKSIVAINCAAIPEPLFESELFGYEEGSFTGASRHGKKGKFVMADGGTLFLDEVGELPLNMQAKLLRVLQEGQVDPIGSARPLPVDVRIIAATNNNMVDLIEQGKFRKDLYFRLNVINITIPPLRQRPKDIIPLAREFLKKHNRPGLEFSLEVINAFHEYPWYGNIREMENVIKHATIVCESNEINLSDLPGYFHEQLRRTANDNPRSWWYDLEPKGQVRVIEKDSLVEALKQCNNNRSQAMRLLGISRRTFYKKMKQHHLLFTE